MSCPLPSSEFLHKVRWHLFTDDDLAAMPEISRHDHPQIAPQEYDCGCVALTRITDRDARRGDQPFEMRLARPCGTEACKVAPLIGGKS